MFKHILISIDGSKLSGKALRSAISVAKSAHARLTVLHILPRLESALYLTDFIVDPGLLKDAEERARQQGEKYLGRACETARRAGVRCVGRLVSSDQISKSIISTARARNCDLIVMASHGRRGMSALVLGSETTKVLTHCKRPVLVVR